jgi:hypothetical protein
MKNIKTLLLSGLAGFLLCIPVFAASGAAELLDDLAWKMQRAQSPSPGTLFFPAREDLTPLIGADRTQVIAALGEPSACEERAATTCQPSSKHEYFFFPKHIDWGVVLELHFDARARVSRAEWQERPLRASERTGDIDT